MHRYGKNAVSDTDTDTGGIPVRTYPESIDQKKIIFFTPIQLGYVRDTIRRVSDWIRAKEKKNNKKRKRWRILTPGWFLTIDWPSRVKSPNFFFFSPFSPSLLWVLAVFRFVVVARCRSPTRVLFFFFFRWEWLCLCCCGVPVWLIVVVFGSVIYTKETLETSKHFNVIVT